MAMFKLSRYSALSCLILFISPYSNSQLLDENIADGTLYRFDSSGLIIKHEKDINTNIHEIEDNNPDGNVSSNIAITNLYRKKNASGKYLLMLGAIRWSEALENDLSYYDRAILAQARSNLNNVYARSINLLENVCRKVLIGEYTDAQDAQVLGKIYNLSDAYEREDSIGFFDKVISSLSDNGARLLNESVEKGYASGPAMDYQEFAKNEPGKFLSIVHSTCENK